MSQSLQADMRKALPTFDDALPLNSRDQEFAKEFRELLIKHGNLDRFGLTLLHEHFALEEDEILLETNDPEARTLSLEVIKRSELANGNLKATSWNFSTMTDGEISLKSMTACAEDKCKAPVVMTACAEDKCKAPVVMTACAEDKCKAPVVMTACAEDKCKAPVVMTA
ncbi:MAG: hypothetical protein AAGG00_17315, partial [Cyanobacteria bacterium P01_H01_bin.150]